MADEKIVKEVVIYGNELDVIVEHEPNEIVRFVCPHEHDRTDGPTIN